MSRPGPAVARSRRVLAGSVALIGSLQGLALLALAAGWPAAGRAAPAAVVIAGTAALCLVTARHEPDGLGWAVLAAGHTLLLVAGGPAAAPVAVHAGFAAAVGAAAWLLVRPVVPASRTWRWADAAVIGLGALALGLAAVPDGLVARIHVALACAVLTIAGLAANRRVGHVWWLACGLLIAATGSVIDATLGGGGPGLSGALGVDRLALVLWLFGYAVVGLVAVFVLFGGTAERRGAGAPAAPDDLVLALAVGSAGLLLLAAAAPEHGGVPLVTSVLAAAAVVIAAARPLRPWVGRARRGRRRPATRANLPDGVGAEATGLVDRKTLSDAIAGDAGSAGTDPGVAATEGWSGWTDRIALLLVDLDRFKDVNEALGHEAGDRVLAAVGDRLRAALRPQQLLARLGGDEFAVVVPGAGPEPAQRVAEMLRAQLDEPIPVRGSAPVYVRASIGVATCRLPRDDPSDLMRRADVAVYRAKETGGGIAHFDPAGDRRGTQRLRRIGELHNAVEHGDLEVHLQPQVDLVTGAVCGAEALARWRHPKDGVLLPAAFLPLAAQTGLMPSVSALVVERALESCARWWRLGYQVRVSVNLSAHDLLDEDITAKIPACLRALELPPRALQVEITEEALVSEPATVGALLAGWRELGIAVALDDYGTGYSSLAHLRQLQLDELKLDRAFVADLDRTATNTIVTHTIAMAHGLGMHVVAEGIESQATADALGRAGCDIGQGLHFGDAMDLEAFIAHLRATLG